MSRIERQWLELEETLEIIYFQPPLDQVVSLPDRSDNVSLLAEEPQYQGVAQAAL